MEPQPKKFRVHYKCERCGKCFQQKQHLTRHIRSIHENGPRVKCPTCSLEFNRNDNLKRHIMRHASQTGGAERDPIQEGEMEKQKSDVKEDAVTNEGVCDEQALGGTVRKRVIPAIGMEKNDPMSFLKVNYNKIKKLLNDTISERGPLKWYLSIRIIMMRRQGDQIDRAEPHFRGKCQIALKSEDLEIGLKDSIMKMYNSFLEYQRRGSNWTVDKVQDVTIHMARYRPLRGSNYIPLPIKLRSKHAIINVQNKDNKCFMWSILAALHPSKKDGQRVTRYLKGIPQRLH